MHHRALMFEIMSVYYIYDIWAVAVSVRNKQKVKKGKVRKSKTLAKILLRKLIR
jgi:hypothetical protein